MRTKKIDRKGSTFGGGTYAQRHDQRFQAVTGAIVIGLAVATLALHHFGFGFALVLAIGAAVLCAVTRLQAVASAYVVGLALFAGMLMTPLSIPGNAVTPGNAAAVPSIQPGPGMSEYELYVLESPSTMGQQRGLQPIEMDAEQWSAEPPNPEAPRTYSL